MLNALTTERIDIDNLYSLSLVFVYLWVIFYISQPAYIPSRSDMLQINLSTVLQKVIAPEL